MEEDQLLLVQLVLLEDLVHLVVLEEVGVMVVLHLE